MVSKSPRQLFSRWSIPGTPPIGASFDLAVNTVWSESPIVGRSRLLACLGATSRIVFVGGSKHVFVAGKSACYIVSKVMESHR